MSISPEERRGALRREGAELVWRVQSARTPAGRPPIVLIHGLASNMTRWSEFVRETALGADHDLIRVDLRGHGESMTRRAFTLTTWVDDLLALLDAEGIHASPRDRAQHGRDRRARNSLSGA